MYIVLPLSLSSDWNILLNVVNEPNTTEHRIRQSWTCGWGYFEFHCKDVGWDKRKCPWDGLAGSSSGTCETYCCLRPCVQKYLSLHWHPPKLRVQCSIVRALIFLTLNLCFVSEVPWDSEEWFGGLEAFPQGSFYLCHAHRWPPGYPFALYIPRDHWCSLSPWKPMVGARCCVLNYGIEPVQSLHSNSDWKSMILESKLKKKKKQSD